jgi:hypothetical protein
MMGNITSPLWAWSPDSPTSNQADEALTSLNSIQASEYFNNNQYKSTTRWHWETFQAGHLVCPL